jgi:S-adenosylmethionine:tRNA ribosyltransferase-isomerase
MKLANFAYNLPRELIATQPLAKRSDSRLLLLQGNNIKHHKFTELTQLLTKQDLLVFNNSKVIPARLYCHKVSGGKVEILIEKIINPQLCLAQLRSSRPPTINSYMHCGQHSLKVLGRSDRFFILKLTTANSIMDVLNNLGELPLPPYFKRRPAADDQQRYQTIYAQEPGSVAAPTAGLHFDTELMTTLTKQGITTAFITLHVGAGTFLPVTQQNIESHQLHYEQLEVSSKVCQQVMRTKAAGGRVIAVGTTSTRSLETAALQSKSAAEMMVPYCGTSNLFIYPGYKFKCIDALLTNFHLPQSSLLMLACAFGGYEAVMNAYQVAIAEKYRFYSYGDAMLILPPVGSSRS